MWLEWRGQAAWTGNQESLILVLSLILICCVTLGRYQPLSGRWIPQNSRSCQLYQPIVHHPCSVRGPSANQFLIICWRISDKRILVPNSLPLNPAGFWAESPWPDGMCAREFQANFNIQSNIIGIINLKKKKTTPFNI